MSKARERAQFRKVFEAHREPIFRLLWRLAGNPHDAEDLLQETFVTYWRKSGQFRGDGSLQGYLRKIAYRLYLNARSRIAAKNPPLRLTDARADAAVGTEDPVETEVVAEDTRRFLVDRVREAVNGLPDRVREAFLLFRFEGLTAAAVAEMTGAPVKTVESRLKRATELLSTRLAKHKDQILPL